MARLLTRNKKGQDVVNLILGVLLFLSPWLITGFSNRAAEWNAWIAGALLIIFAAVALSEYAEWEEWTNLIIGAWVIISPWVLRFADNSNALWTHLIFGVLALLVSVWALWDYRQHGHVPA